MSLLQDSLHELLRRTTRLLEAIFVAREVSVAERLG